MHQNRMGTGVLVGACVFAALAAIAGEEGAADLPEQHRHELDALYRQIHETHVDLDDDPGREEPIRLEGADERPDLTTGMSVLRGTNPLISEECKKEALYQAIRTHARVKGLELEQSLDAVSRHITEQQRIISRDGISIAGYYEHLTRCKGFCGPHAVELLSCHVHAVASSDRDIVLFDLDSSYVSTRYNDDVVRRYASALRRDPDSKLLLIGRASPPGPNAHNMRLSAKRALAVGNILAAEGVGHHRFSTLWLGEEPPQLEDWIADKYQLMQLREIEGYERLNQSVIVVQY